MMTNVGLGTWTAAMAEARSYVIGGTDDQGRLTTISSRTDDHV